jgi:3-dehydroquinate dehydratase/shikimate dehydrogenase
MGDIGAPSRLLAGKFGAPFSYATFHHERTLAPGQLTFRQMTEIYDYDHIGPDTEIYGVIADPVGDIPHPVVHNAAFREFDLDKAYLPFRVPVEDLDQFFDDCEEMDIKGVCVWLPHKEAVVHSVQRYDEASENLRTVNTVVFEGEDRVGYNTEDQAAIDSLSSAFGEASGRDPLRGRSVLILGAGALAKAIALGMIRSGANVTVAARNMRRAEALTERLDCRLIDWDSRHAMGPNILINATPVGAHPNVDQTPYDRHHLRRSMIVFDTIYYPEQTMLIKEARQQGCPVVTGVEMFARHAAHQSRLFTGRQPPLDLMREEVKRIIRPGKY